MLTKKMKKLGKECRKAGGPMLSALSAYLDHMVAYFECGEERGADLGTALAGIDLRAVAAARAALPSPEPIAEHVDDEKAGKKEKKAKKKDRKEKERAAAADPDQTPCSDQTVPMPVVGNDSEEPAAEKKDKKKKKRKDK